MDKPCRSLLILAMLAPAAFAHEHSACVSSLNIRDVPAAMGEQVTAQPVYVKDTMKGWRLYGTRTSEQLTRQGINPGALMTHVCGVHASEIPRSGEICCNVDTSREFEVTFQFSDHDTKVLIRRP